jgi:hypothetical protein
MSAPHQTDTNGTYDLIVLGAGPVGQNVADRARTSGLSVAVVERELVGGECSYWACVPSKALLRPVIAVADARRVDGARQAVTGRLDNDAVFARRNRYVTDWRPPPGTTSRRSTSTSTPPTAPTSTPMATPAMPGWSWTWTGTCCSG